MTTAQVITGGGEDSLRKGPPQGEVAYCRRQSLAVHIGGCRPSLGDPPPFPPPCPLLPPQSISALECLRRVGGVRGPFLLVAPLTTLGHWQREIRTWTDMVSGGRRGGGVQRRREVIMTGHGLGGKVLNEG